MDIGRGRKRASSDATVELVGIFFSHLPAKLVGCESSASFSFALLTLLPWVSCWALVFFLDTHLEIFIFTV